MGEELMRKVWSICADRYGAALPDVIFNRLQQELQNITANGFSEDYLSTSGICLELQHRNALQICLGTVGNSFVAYLLGITEINPLPPHYRCPHCKRVTFVSDVLDGFDLPPQDCPVCRTPMEGDGHHLHTAWFTGWDGTCPPAFGEFRMTPKGIQITEQALKKHSPLTPLVFSNGRFAGWYLCNSENLSHAEWVQLTYPGHPNHIVPGVKYNCDLPVPRILVHDSVFLRKLEWLSDVTGVELSSIPMNNPAIYNAFCRALEYDTADAGNLLCTTGLCTPEELLSDRFTLWRRASKSGLSFSRLVSLYGVMHMSVRHSSALDLSTALTFSDRDSVMEYLIRQGLPPKDAFQIADNMRYGRFAHMPADAYPVFIQGINDDGFFFHAAQNTEYLFPRAHNSAVVMNTVRLAWFSIYEPSAFREVQDIAHTP